MEKLDLTGALGLGSFGLIAAAALVGPPLWEAPATTATAAEIAAYTQDERGRAIASLFLYSVAFGLFLCFVAGLWARLRRTETAPGPLSAAFAGGGIALTTLIFAAFAVGGVLAYRPWDPQLAQVLNDMLFALLALSGIPTAVCLGAYAALVARGGDIPAWTAWLAATSALAHLVIAASLAASSGPLSLEGEVILVVPGTFFAWMLATGAVLLKRPCSG